MSGKISVLRRLMLAGTPLALVAGLAFGAPAHAQELILSGWGGSYQDAIRKAWIEPFTAKTGIKVREDTGPEIAKIKAMVDTGTVTWDLVTEGAGGLIQGAAAGLFDKIAPVEIDMSSIYPEARSEHGVPSEVFSHVVGYSLAAFPNGKPQPKTWADFFDVEKFPGKRSVYAKPSTTLEAALMADGVPRDKVYAELATDAGLDRALAKLRALKPHVAQWWTSGAQPVQALASGEVALALIPNGRVAVAVEQGAEIAMSWDGAIAQTGYILLVKGAPNRANALKFLEYVASPEAQAKFHEYIPYGPINQQAWDKIAKDKWALLPTSPDNLAVSLFSSNEFWAANEARITPRWLAFMQES